MQQEDGGLVGLDGSLHIVLGCVNNNSPRHHTHLVHPPQMYCYVIATCACFNSCNLGYDVGSVGGAALLMKEYFGWSEWDLGFYVGSINFFAIIGAFNAGIVCDRFGRVKTFTISCVIFIVGLLFQVLVTRCVNMCWAGVAPNRSQIALLTPFLHTMRVTLRGPHSFPLVMVGRVLVGMGVGLGES